MWIVPQNDITVSILERLVLDLLGFDKIQPLEAVCARNNEEIKVAEILELAEMMKPEMKNCCSPQEITPHEYWVC